VSRIQSDDHAIHDSELRCAIFWQQYLEVVSLLQMGLMVMQDHPDVQSMSIIRRDIIEDVRLIELHLDRLSTAPHLF
jgi:hypothetical protein